LSKRARLLFVCGCLGVSALHLPSAAHSARTGLRGPYGTQAASDALAASDTALESTTNAEAPLRLSSNLPRFSQAAGLDVAWAPLVSEGM